LILVRSGDADARLRLVAELAGFSDFSVRHEAYEVCFAEALADDPRIQALTAALGASNYRRQIADLPGYNAKALGETSGV
jgi:molybdate-binding protein